MKNAPSNHLNQKAFTLIELSIVLVIVGLVVGGVLVSKDLIRAAEVRKAVTDVEQIKISINLFKNQFGQLPGDSDKMWDIYGTDCASSEAQCNGDNNKKICRQYSRAACGGRRGEDSCVFRHLALAGFWNGPTYADSCTSSSEGVGQPKIDSYPGIVPTTLDKKYLHISAWELYAAKEANSVTITAPSINFGGIYMHAAGANALTLSTAYNIDNKFDDGQPASGAIWVSPAYASNECLNTSLYTTPSSTVNWYSNLDITGGRCQVHFWID